MKFYGNPLFTLATLFMFSAGYAQVPPQDNGERSGSGTGLGEMTVPHFPASSQSSIFTRDGRYGLKKGDSILLAPVYEKLSPLGGSVILVQQGKYFGATNLDGKMIVPIEFDSIKEYYSGKSILLLKNGKWGSRNNEGEVLLPLMYDAIFYSSAENGYSYASKNKQQIFLYDGHPIKEAVSAGSIFNSAVIVRKGNQFGILQKGMLTVPFEYDSIYLPNAFNYPTPIAPDFIDTRSGADIFITKKNKLLGLIQTNGTVLFPAENDKVTYDRSRKLFYVQKDSLSAIYFEHSHQQTAIAFSSIYTDGMQHITVKKKGKYGMLDYSNNTILPFEYDKIDIMGFNTGFRVKQHGKSGWLNGKGQTIVPVMYDDIDDFRAGTFKGLYKVSIDKKHGVVNEENKLIVPLLFENIYEEGSFIIGYTADKKAGLYAINGREICQPVYSYFKKSISRGSNIIFAYKDSLTGIIDGKGTILYEPSFKNIRYITDSDGLLNPITKNRKSFQLVKNTYDQFGVFEEITAKVVVPVVYDSILQKFETDSTAYFAVKKGKKYGIVSADNRIVLPIIYDSITLNLSGSTAPLFVVKKGNYYGAVGLDNVIVIPFAYRRLGKVSYDNLFKAWKKDHYELIDAHNTVISSGPFTDIAQFQGEKALSFFNGMMTVIDRKGNLISTAVPMQPHTGYQTFDALKFALIEAFDSPDNTKLKLFADQAAPSTHLLYFITLNRFSKTALNYTAPEVIRLKYYKDLLDFKRNQWKGGFYRRTSLTNVADYTMDEQDGYVGNRRVNDHAFGDTRFLEKFLRDAIKVNGYWISTYFMKRSFQH